MTYRINKINLRYLIVCLSIFGTVFGITNPVYAAATTVNYLGESWNHDPINIYISLDRGVDQSYANDVQTVLNDWNSRLKIATGSANFNFDIVATPQNRHIPADISIRIKRNTGAVLGTTYPYFSSENFTYVKITIATQNSMGKPLDRSEFRNILRHELGHAIGLEHANDDGILPTDLMYPYYDFVEIGYDIYPSTLDIDALVNIYKNDGFGGMNVHPIPANYHG